MSQEEVEKLLRKTKWPLSSKEIAIKLGNSHTATINNIRKLRNWGDEILVSRKKLGGRRLFLYSWKKSKT